MLCNILLLLGLWEVPGAAMCCFRDNCMESLRRRRAPPRLPRNMPHLAAAHLPCRSALCPRMGRLRLQLPMQTLRR